MSFKIAIASGKGGTGKTTVAVNLWHILSNDFGNKISLVDCDVEEPNDKLFFPESNTISNKEVKQIFPEVNEDNCVYCRKCAEYCEFNAIMVVPSAKYIQVSDELCHSCGACFYACEYDALKEVPMRVGAINQYRVTKDKILTEGSLDVGLPFQTPVIRELKKDTEDISDIILYDAPPGTSCSVVSTLTNTDLILLVTEPTPFGLNDLKLMVSLLEKMNITNYGVIINKAGVGDDETLHYLHKENIPLIASIPFSKEVAEAYATGQVTSVSLKEQEKYYYDVASFIKKHIK